ncbi:spondin-1 [Drosophila willistoni]|nr:spondin-1 [Drosophila willistoni]
MFPVKMRSVWALFLLCILYFISEVESECNRIPQGASGDRSAVDENFKILIDGNPTTYIPGNQYNVSLSCPNGLKFISFTLALEGEDQSPIYNGLDMTGHFELFDNTDTRFATGCENLVESTNTNAKARIDVSWIAPKQPESGCVLMKASVVQHRDVWFIDDGFLTKRICAEEIDDLNSLTPPLQNCCACDEAKYEILLERKWARNTHAKDFPNEAWRTHLGEIIGASHNYNYRYWAYGERASKGMKELAEHGSTRTLENEIRENTQNGQVRTIIKAPGISYRRNVFGTTLANARVDKIHHQISLSVKINPSPDWILGISGLELCLSNCTWLERKTLNLYPWDIGTDSGPSYMSADEAQVPPDVIRRITSSYPSDYRSPFFDDSGAPMKPLATLYLTRKKLYIRECEEDMMDQDGPLECATHPWNEWNNCSARCGPGLSQRMRSYKNPILAANYNCDRRLDEMRQCQGTQCGVDAEEESPNADTGIEQDGSSFGVGSMAECELTTWSEWSPCSATCGKGISTRSRDYFNSRARARCMTAVRLPLEEQRQCFASDCGGTITDNGEFDDLPQPDVFGETNEPSGKSWNNNAYNKPSGYNSLDNSHNWPTTIQTPYAPMDTPNQHYQSPYSSNDQGISNYNEYGTDYTTPRQMPYFTTRLPALGSRYNDRPKDASNYKVVQDYCFKKPEASTTPCLANPVTVRNYWFYDHEDHECKIFTSDNCDENRNRFRTLDSCLATCYDPQLNLERTENEAMDLYEGNANSNMANNYNQGYAGGPTPNPYYYGAKRGRYGT